MKEFTRYLSDIHYRRWYDQPQRIPRLRFDNYEFCRLIHEMDLVIETTTSKWAAQKKTGGRYFSFKRFYMQVGYRRRKKWSSTPEIIDWFDLPDYIRGSFRGHIVRLLDLELESVTGDDETWVQKYDHP